MNIVLLLLLGVFSGVISGLLGIGGGVILVPALIFLARFEVHYAIGVSLAVIVPTALIGAMKHYALGHYELSSVLVLALGGMAGAYFGAKFSASVPDEMLKRIFGVLLLVLACNMIFGWSESLIAHAQQRAQQKISNG